MTGPGTLPEKHNKQMSEIAIINYGIGNLTSVKNMLRKAGADDVVITSDEEQIRNASKLILPGVGHFDYGISKLHESGLVEVLNDLVLNDKKTILGICLGAQLMTASSEEGEKPGLGWVDGKTIAFDRSKLPNETKIPHMGWNYVDEQKACKLFDEMHSDPRFYFVHSFHLEMNNPADVWLTTNYEGYEFCSAYQHNNIFACQFHPEKSHKFGLKLMENFVTL